MPITSCCLVNAKAQCCSLQLAHVPSLHIGHQNAAGTDKCLKSHGPQNMLGFAAMSLTYQNIINNAFNFMYNIMHAANIII
jgi:hypothetical protein